MATTAQGTGYPDRTVPYSTRRRTALVLTGAGSAGAYHAGVLKAFAEAGVRLDIVAGQGMGAISALFHAVDGGTVLWDANGVWHHPHTIKTYRWRPAVRLLTWAAAAALATVVVPVVVMASGVFVYLAAFVLGLAGVASAGAVADRFTRLVHDGFQPGRLTTWVPQAAVLLLAVVFVCLILASWRARIQGRYREQGGFWWRVFGAPLTAMPSIRFWRAQLWRLLVGGARVNEPDAVALSRRYGELLAENIGQPGFRELIVLTHDVDARHDVAAAALAEPYRQAFFARAGRDDEPRASETLDLVGADREHLTDVLAAALCLPAAVVGWPIHFAPASHWRGETHRLCDRPGSVGRLLDEVLAAGAEQVILVSPVSGHGAPHSLTAPRVDGTGKLGEWLASQERAAVRDAVAARRASFRVLCCVTPSHNPTGPLDFGGAYDDRSDRIQFLPELVARGYEDAYHQFIEPMVGGDDGGAATAER